MAKDKRILSSDNISKYLRLKKIAFKENDIISYNHYGNMLYDHEKAIKEQQMKKKRLELIGKTVLGKKIYKKVFGRVTYILNSTHSSKKIATKEANKLRRLGYHIRIIKEGKKYSIYKHKK